MNLDEQTERCAQSVEATDRSAAIARASRILVDVTSQLSGVPAAQRRAAALMASVFAVVLLVVGITPWLRDSPSLLRGLAVVVLVVALALGLIAWGLLRSVAMDRAESLVDAAVEAAVEAAGQQMCSCGVAHDPDEMHITEPKIDGCAPTDAACTHSCATCVLARVSS
jgi:hypothetical protein